MKCQLLANVQAWRIPLIIPACDHRTFLRAQKDVDGWMFVIQQLLDLKE